MKPVNALTNPGFWLQTIKTVFKPRSLFLILGCVPLLYTALAQENTIIDDSIFSSVLNEQRNLKILVPSAYKPGSGTTYDVVYVLDGERHFDDFSFIYEFARKENLIPPLILVALPNTYTREGNMRDRDFLPEKTPGNLKAGGADRFIAFLKDELIPYIDKKLSTSGDNSLYGHSLGGLFAFYVLLSNPHLFSNYYCSDPAFPWNERRMITMATETFRNTSELDQTLWINGVEDTYRNVGIQKMDSVLNEYAPEGLRWKISVYPGETHMSVRLKGIYDGLRFSFDGYNSKKLTEFHPNNGFLLKGKSLIIYLNGSFPNVYYTTDGSEPDTSSAKAPQMIEITGPVQLKVRWIGKNEKYVTTTTGNFETGEAWPALQHVKNLKAGGLRYSLYEGKWESLPDFNNLKAAGTGIADSSFTLEEVPAGPGFGCVFEGYLKTEEDGYYMFALCSSDGSKLFINGHEIINNDGLHGNEWYRSCAVPLQTGYYPVRLEYFQNGGHPSLNMIFLPPESHETVKLTFNMMYY